MVMVLFLYAVLASSFTTSKAALLYVQPLFFTVLRMIPAGIGFLGMIPVTLAHGLQAFGYPTWEEFLILCSVISSAYGWYIVQRLVRDAGYRPSVVNGISMLCGGFLALISSLIWEGGIHERL